MAVDPEYILEPLREGADFTLYRGRERGNQMRILAVAAAAEQPSPQSLQRLEHEHSLAGDLDAAWAVRPLALTRHQGRALLVLTDPGGEPLDRIIEERRGQPIDLIRFLRIAIGLAASLGAAHRQGLIHKDIKPANALVDDSDRVWLAGFGIASKLPQQRQAPVPPEIIGGTLAYMAPEQTGRMNRSIDSRSDLYSLGVTLYEMLTDTLPFDAGDPLEWVHCHIARQPVAPIDRRDVPEPLSAIVMKLLAKNAEERYQTAAGLEADLQRCLTEWQSQGRIAPFTLGANDSSGRLLIPQKLYGREREVETLVAAFDRVVAQGSTGLVLVSGYSGVGKSSVVNELHKVLIPTRGLFAAGKFDQYKREVPYTTLAQAFQTLVRQILVKSEADVEHWRRVLVEALWPNGQLIIDLIPELEFVIGNQPPVPEMTPREARGRFQLVLQRFIGAFARPEHPLALFLDDLQWLDSATLDLIEEVLTRSDLQHLILIGAYRDDEIDDSHPLRRKLAAIAAAAGNVGEITLGSLEPRHLGQLIADALHCTPGRAAPLAEFVHDKTGGNPFFAIRFINSLAEEDMIVFDHEAASWSWDLDRIRAEDHTGNIVDLMAGKLTRLPPETQQALQVLACLGHTASAHILAIALGMTEERLHEALWHSIRDELVEQDESAYKFTHDRVQEAAYSLLPEDARAELHLRIGRLLVANTPVQQRTETVFEIVNQLNRATGLITSEEEREQLAELNLLAGQRAKNSTAFASALNYAARGSELLPDCAWEQRHDLIFALYLLRAECEFLTSDLAAAEARLDMLSARAAGTVDLAGVACLRMDLYTTLDRSTRALAVGLDYLRHQGIDWSPNPTDEEARSEYERVWSQLESRTIEELIDLPLMTDSASLATLGVLMKLWPAAMFTDMNLFALTMCSAVKLSLEHGNSDGSCTAYVQLGAIAASRFGDYQAASHVGRLGYDLVEQRGLKRFQARTYLLFGALVLPWMKHVATARDVLRLAFSSANERGDFAFAAASAGHLNANMLAASDPLIEVQNQAESGLAFAQKIRFGLASDVFSTQLQTARMLRGLTRTFGSFDDEEFSESLITARFSGNPNLGYAECLFWIRKLQGYVLAGDFEAAVDASLRPRPLFWTAQSALEMAGYHFYAALARAALCDSIAPEQRGPHQDALLAHYREIEKSARECPENFANRAALVGAEIARLEGRDIEAMRLYEEAIRLAREHGFVQNEGLAYEVAARFYNARGFVTFADAYLGKARDCYLRWGADGKVRQLDRLHPQLAGQERQRPTGRTGAPAVHLDVASVTQASQALSSEIVLPDLIERLMTIVLQNAGAERGLLIVVRDGEPRIEAEVMTDPGEIVFAARRGAVTPCDLPQSVLQYAIRTQQHVLLDDALLDDVYAKDEYVQGKRPRSVLCLPIVRRAQVVGALYLENNLAPCVFTQERVAVLRLLASQAAISLENATLYTDLQRSEAFLAHGQKLSRTGSFGRNALSEKLYWSEEAYEIHELDRSVEPTLGWLIQRIHSEDRFRVQEAIESAIRQKRGFDIEYRFVTRSGSLKYLHVVVQAQENASNELEFVGAITDITERKLAEQAFHQALDDLARINRVMTMGELTAALAHEVSQPISGAIINANVAKRMLEGESPDLDGVRVSVARIERDAQRAAEIINRTRSQFEKSPLNREVIDVNESIRATVALLRAEADRHGIIVRTELATGLPQVVGDRVQLQQVAVNLIVNSIEAMKEFDGRRELAITSERAENGRILVSVSDTGPGIPPHLADQIFDPFFTTKPHGTGMGLRISRSIIESHGGRLWANPLLGHGAVFYFSLPAARIG